MPVITMNKPVDVDVKVMKLCLKVRDEFAATFHIDNNSKHILFDYEGYVPGFMPGDHYGDYVELEIDLDTGKILNWYDKDRFGKLFAEFYNSKFNN